MLIIGKIKERFVGNDHLRSAARYTHPLPLIASIQIARCRAKVEALHEGTLFELHDIEDTLCVDRNLARATTAWQPYFRPGIATDDTGIEVAEAVNLCTA